MSIDLDTLTAEVIELLQRQTYDVEEEKQISDTEIEIETVTRNVSIGNEQKALIKALMEAIMNHILKNEVSNPDGTTGTSNFAVIKSDSDEDSVMFNYIDKLDNVVAKLDTFIGAFASTPPLTAPGSGGGFITGIKTTAIALKTALASLTSATKPTSITSRIDS